MSKPKNTAPASQTDHGVGRQGIHRMFVLVVIIPTITAAAYWVTQNPSALRWDLLAWAAVLIAVGLLPVPVWHGLQLSLDFPVLIGVGLVHPAAPAAFTALLGVSDRREIAREIPPLRAMFNRSQVALGVLASSTAFHSLSAIARPWSVVVPAALVAGLIFYATNVVLVGTAASTARGDSFGQTVRGMWIGRLHVYLLNYLGLAFVGAVLAKLYVDPTVGVWAMPAVLAPLLFARQMFFRTKELEETNEELQTAHTALQERQRVVEILSNRMAEERQDERSQIAAYLHDDVAQLLFRLSLQVDIARRHLRAESHEKIAEDLEAIRDTKERTNERIRGLIRDLDRSPLGPAGLGPAIASFTEDAAGGLGISFHIAVNDLPLPPPVQLLLYHITREAVMNAVKHAGAANMWIRLEEQPNDVVMAIRDDGIGFDASMGSPDGHFGVTLMRERARVAGGTLEIVSAPRAGTPVEVHLPPSWINADALPKPGAIRPYGEVTTDTDAATANAYSLPMAPRVP
jgi:signal transduction histidine kinase